jgi:hypothetical protein
MTSIISYLSRKIHTFLDRYIYFQLAAKKWAALETIEFDKVNACNALNYP